MKLVFFESTRRWTQTASSGLLLLGLLWAPLVAMATPPYSWISSDYGSLFNNANLPQIDATNFVNTGTWAISTVSLSTYAPILYETSQTLNYTNRGTMISQIGWEFDNGPLPTGGRGWSANFFNANNATISSLDGPVPTFLQQIVQESFLIVSATNIVNQGLLSAGAGGEIILSGGSINLSHSGGLEITPIVGVGSRSGTTNFTSDTSIYSEYWAASNGNVTVTGPLWDGTNYYMPFPVGGVGLPCGISNQVRTVGPFTPDLANSVTTNVGPFVLVLTNDSTGGSISNLLVYTNLYRQAVFVYLGPNNIIGQTRFTPTGDPSNAFDIVAIQLGTVALNVVTDQGQTDSVYIVDSFAASTNHDVGPDTQIDPNAVCTDLPLRPNAYNVGRIVPLQFSAGLTNVVVPPATFFYQPNFTNYVVAGASGAAYEFRVDNEAAQVPPNGSVTDLPGRVRVYANNLNLNQAHVRAEGQIVIQASNLISSLNAAMDCQNLSYNIGSTSGNLNFTSLAVPQVGRLNGTVQMATAVWSNLMVNIYVNFAPTNAGAGPPYVESDITNIVLVNLSVTVVDASGLQSTVPVTVQDLILHSTNIVVSDSVVVDESLILDGLSATLAGNMTLAGDLQSWVYTNAPSLRYFTNNGYLSIGSGYAAYPSGAAHFGDDGPTNYLTFVNNGTIDAGEQYINSMNIQINSGAYDYCNYGGFTATAQNAATLTGATVESQSDMQFAANNLYTYNGCLLLTLGTLNLTVNFALDDGGPAAGNNFYCQNGFNLTQKPTRGDLKGTTIASYAPLNNEIYHTWAGADWGTDVIKGYNNNASVQTLALVPEGPQDPGYQPLFDFFGATGANGLYVSNLDLSLLDNYAAEMYIDSSITIYFVSAILNSGVNTGGQTPEQFLDHQFNNHLRWMGVSSLVKPKALKFGLTGSYKGANGQFQLVGNCPAGQTNFVIQASTDLKNWVPIFTNNGPFGTYTDPSAGAYPYRFYRTVSGH